MEIGMEFERFPNFLGNKWASGMEIGIFEVVSKILSRSAFPEMELVGMQGNGLRALFKLPLSERHIA
ncbi:hypothetical protein CSW08_13870 [Confluentibacter flavum]|uniref:Uncharacterized protein n=1 Tax=Confluentibacter flavum TaxID=1909700 RepID=A0A2N3HGU8_9FLAO|nr:hypothetical protein CSW08_13870 [Confluentibacter flavum]